MKIQNSPEIIKIQDENFKGAIFGYAPFKTGMKLSHEERVEILLNKENYIGKLAEVRFFEFTDNGIPRFPVYYGYRIDK